MNPKDRMGIVLKFQVCFNCLSSSHKIPDCSSQNTCFQDGCGKKHHTTLHDFFSERAKLRKEKRQKKKKDKSQEAKDEDGAAAVEETLLGTTSIAVNLCKKRPGTVYLKIVAATVHLRTP